MRRRRLRILLIVASVVVGLPLLIVAGLLLYLSFADLGKYRDNVESLVTEALGRELTIAGPFEPSIGLTSSLVAGDVTLANPSWSTEPAMARVDHLAVEVDLLSLLFPPVHVKSLEIRGALLRIESDAEGRGNWEFETGGAEPVSDGETGGGIPIIVLERVDVQDFEFVYGDVAADGPIVAFVRELAVASDGDDMLQLNLDGRLGDEPVTVAGRIGTLASLLEAEDVSFDLEGTILDDSFSARGSLTDLAELEGLSLRAATSGPDVAVVAQLIGIPTLGTGPFELSGSVAPAREGSKVQLNVRLDLLSANVEGFVDDLLDPGAFNASVEGSGPDLAAVGALTGVTDLPPRPFELSGRVRWQGFPITFEALSIRVGENVLSLDGVLGEPPGLHGTDIAFQVEGPDLALFSPLAGIDLPPGDFRARSRVKPLEKGVRIEELEAHLADTDVEVRGSLGEPPEWSDTDLQLRVAGPDLSVFRILAGFDLPDGPFEVDGRFAWDGRRIRLDDVAAHVAGIDLQASGRLVPSATLTGSDLQVRAEGSDLCVVADFLDGVDLPSEPFLVDGQVAVEEDGYRSSGLEVRVGEVELRANGYVSNRPGLDGTEATVGLRGSSLAAANAFFDDPPLPDVPFAASGSARVDGETYVLDGVAAEAGSIRVAVEGLLVPSEDLAGTDLNVNLAGANLAETASLVNGTGLTDLPELPAEPYSVSGRAKILGNGYDLDEVLIQLGEVQLRAEGTVGVGPELEGSDLSLDLSGPDASVVGDLAGSEISKVPFRVQGRVARQEGVYLFHGLTVSLADTRAKVDGTLGDPPELIGTNLDVHASGSDLYLVAALAGLEEPPEGSFEVSGHFDGTPTLFSMPYFEARIGESDLSGTVQVDLQDKPEIRGEFSSGYLSIVKLLGPEEKEKPAPEEEVAEEPPPPETPAKKTLLIPDAPLELEVLDKVNADIRISVERFEGRYFTAHDFQVGVQLKDGALQVNPFNGTGPMGGGLVAGLTLVPEENGYRADVRFDLREARFDMSSVERDPKRWPTFDVNLVFGGSGRSLHDIAAGSNGRVVIVVGEGVMDDSIVEVLAADFLLTVLDALNPFRKENPYTNLQCGVFVVNIEDGQASLEPLAFQTRRMTMVGDGKIDLETEKLNLDWVTKPRKGIGLSASALTNPYIKLGGTLANPSVEMKPLEAMTTTGAAVATAGLSLLARGMWDRVTAEKKVCAKAIEKAAKQAGRAEEETPK